MIRKSFVNRPDVQEKHYPERFKGTKKSKMMEPYADCTYVLVDVVDNAPSAQSPMLDTPTTEEGLNYTSTTEEGLNCACCAWCWLGHIFFRMAYGCCLACGEFCKLC